MAWGGQWCTSPGYAYVHEGPVAEQFVANAKKALTELFGDDPKFNSDYSRIINERAVDRLAGLIDPSKVITCGGKSDRDAHYCYPRSDTALSHHLGRQDHGGRDLRTDPADPNL